MGSLKRKAFTLIELLVVIAIIGILSALIIIGMSSTTQKATIAKAQVFSNSLRNSLMGNLVSEWKFDELSTAFNGQAISDTWGTNAGTLTANDAGDKLKSGTDCVNGKCLFFDGNGDYVDFSDMALTENTNTLTISIWIYSNPSSNYRTVISKGYYTSGSWEFRMTGDGEGPKLYFGVVTGGGIIRSNINIFQNSNWHYVCGVYDGVKTYIYYDGISVDSDSQTGNIVDTANTVKIGQNGNSGEYWLGKIDDVRIFNAAMPTSQIQRNYFAGLNKLFAKNQITQSDYHSRIAELSNNYAKQ